MHSSPISWQAHDRALPHWPAPVSVASRLTPSSLFIQACMIAELSLWLPTGLTCSDL
jgi:hypothetical protein